MTSQSSVLDLGSGSGIWAIMAAKLGAHKVVAVERDVLMAGMIKAHCIDNGVEDRVEVITGDGLQVEFSRSFDIVISETIGHVISDEDLVPLMIRARDRFLKPGGSLVPYEVSLWAAPAELRGDEHSLPRGASCSMESFSSLARHAPLSVMDKSQLTIIGTPSCLVNIDLLTATSAPALTPLSARFNVSKDDRVNCIAVWMEAALSPNCKISTLKTSSWSASAYRFQPFAESAEVEFELILSNVTNVWHIRRISAGIVVDEQSYSPAIAAAELLAQSRLGPLGYRKLRDAGMLAQGITPETLIRQPVT